MPRAPSLSIAASVASSSAIASGTTQVYRTCMSSCCGGSLLTSASDLDEPHVSATSGARRGRTQGSAAGSADHSDALPGGSGLVRSSRSISRWRITGWYSAPAPQGQPTRLGVEVGPSTKSRWCRTSGASASPDPIDRNLPFALFTLTPSRGARRPRARCVLSAHRLARMIPPKTRWQIAAPRGSSLRRPYPKWLTDPQTAGTCRLPGAFALFICALSSFVSLLL
jgi:hypothetical protein